MSASTAWANLWADHARWLDRLQADADLAAVRNQANAEYRELHRQYILSVALADGLRAQLDVALQLLEDARPGAIATIGKGLEEHGEQVALATLKNFEEC